VWALSLVTQPAAEPVLYEDAKKQLRLNQDEERAFIEDGLIPSARKACETFTQRQLITATWDLLLDSWFEEGVFRSGSLWIPKAPLRQQVGPVDAPTDGVLSITYVDSAGATQTWARSKYAIQAPQGPDAQRGRISLAYGESWPSTRCQVGAITVRYRAGYGPAPEAVPAPLRQGMLIWIAELYERREEVTTGIVAANPITAERLWWPLRSW
jgi:uncharacterized phiE125 gp8 family phage protein